MNPYDYSTAADYARISGYHRTTIVEWIKQGKILVVNKTVKSKKKNSNKHWKIAHKSMKKPFKKGNLKSGTVWSDVEIYTLRNNLHLTNKDLAVMIGRGKNAVKIKKCRERLIKPSE